MVIVELVMVAVVEVGTTDGSAKTCQCDSKTAVGPDREVNQAEPVASSAASKRRLAKVCQC